LVVLNACRSARVDTTDPFSGMAQGLVQQHVTAVVAMQFPISDKAASTFAAHFYRSLCDGNPVDQSVTWARQSLLIDYGGEWATPVLFLRSPDGHVFEQIEPRAPVDVDPSSVRRRPAVVDETATPPPPSAYAPQDFEDDSGTRGVKEERRRRVGLWLIPALTVLAAIGFFAFINLRSTPDPVSTAPTSTTATTTTTAPSTTTSESSTSSGSKSVPPPQPAKATIPYLLGLSLADAKTSLVAAGFDAKRISVTFQTSSKPKGTVVAVNPPGGTVPVTTAITLTVAAEPTTTTATTQPPTSVTTGPSVSPTTKVTTVSRSS
jgi:hypothetical protein